MLIEDFVVDKIERYVATLVTNQQDPSRHLQVQS